MPPKKQSAKSAVPVKGTLSKKAKESKDSTKKDSLPSWALFTIKSVEFSSAARDLSDRLKLIYGPETTISQFGKFVAEYPALTPEQKSLIMLDKMSLNLLQLYQTAKDAKDTERRTFRSDAPIKDITTGLEACLSTFDGEEGDEDEEVLETLEEA